MRTNTSNTASLGGLVTVDRNWAQALGVDRLNGVRRVGNFYQIPRAQLKRLNGAVPSPQWTAQDDRAVAALLAETAAERAPDPCVDCPS